MTATTTAPTGGRSGHRPEANSVADVDLMHPFVVFTSRISAAVLLLLIEVLVTFAYHRTDLNG